MLHGCHGPYQFMLQQDYRTRFLVRLAFVVGCCYCPWLHGQSAMERLLPKNAPVFVAIEPIGNVLDHGTVVAFRQSNALKTVWRSNTLSPIRGGIAIAELAIAEKLESIVRKLGAQGICLALDQETGGWIILLHSEDETWLASFLRKIFDFARSDAKKKGEPDPIREASYREITGFEIQKNYLTSFGSILVVSNKTKLVKETIDRHLDSTAASEDDSGVQHYRAFRASTKANCLASGYINLDEVRRTRWTREVLGSKPLDFLGELLLGGVVAALRNTNTLSGMITARSNELHFEFSTPYDKTWNATSRSFFVGPESKGAAPNYRFGFPVLASIGAYRNVSELWASAGDLFDERVNEQLANADNTLTTLFSGKDVGTDILGAIEPELQFVATDPLFNGASKPTVQLPRFAVLATLKNIETKRDLKRTFQSLIGFLNIAGAQEGRPQLDLENETLDGAQFFYANYVLDKDKKYENGLPIEFNFSPTLAFQGNKICLASSFTFAQQLLKSLEEPKQSMFVPANTQASIDFGLARQIIESNRDSLVAQNMLEKGHSKSNAEAEIEMLQRIMGLFRAARARLTFDAQMRLELELELNQ